MCLFAKKQKSEEKFKEYKSYKHFEKTAKLCGENPMQWIEELDATCESYNEFLGVLLNSFKKPKDVLILLEKYDFYRKNKNKDENN